MKVFKKILGGALALFVLLIIILYIFDYDYLIKGVRSTYLKGHSTAFLEDYNAFDNAVVEAPEGTIPWPKHVNYNTINPTEKLVESHKESGTIAYVIIKNDSIWHETYYDGFDENRKSNSFSMAKSFISGLLGKAIMDGYIENLDQPLGDFYPQYEGTKTTVGDLASMASGLDWDEDYYDPFSITTKAYFYDNLEKMMLELDIVEEPGKEHKYLSGSTQMLAMVIEKASGKKIPEYFSEAFWKPLGAKNDALWQLDSKEHGLVKAYCCFASNALDFARFGKLYKDHGSFNGKQILDSSFVAKSIKPRFEGTHYGYGFYLGNYNDKEYFVMRGHLGQYVIVIPEDNLIIVRLGHSKRIYDGSDSSPESFWRANFWIDQAYKMLN